jgi:AraC-like DNA-binding protein
VDDNSWQEVDENLKERILRLMNEEKVFKRADLTLFDMAKILEVQSKTVSNTINKGLEMNFNDFINSYRVAEVIVKMQASETDTKTILGIAYDCGFNSKSTFNRAFKKHAKLTPKEFLSKNGLK